MKTENGNIVRYFEAMKGDKLALVINGDKGMHLFHAEQFTGELLPDCREGTLEWVPVARLGELNAWEGDRIFLELLQKRAPFFSLKLVYEGDRLADAVLDGERLRR